MPSREALSVFVGRALSSGAIAGATFGFYQASVRFAVTKDFLLDASVGNRIDTGASERWYSIGLHYQTPPFIP